MPGRWTSLKERKELSLRVVGTKSEWGIVRGGGYITHSNVHAKITQIPRLTRLTAVQIKAMTNVTSMSLKEPRVLSPRDPMQYLTVTTEASAQAPCQFSSVLRNPRQTSVVRKFQLSNRSGT